MGTWRVSGYPEEWPPRPALDDDVVLAADGTARRTDAPASEPAGSWRAADGIVRVTAVRINGVARSWWWWVDTASPAAIGRDQEAAVVRGVRRSTEAPVPAAPALPAAVAVPARPAFAG